MESVAGRLCGKGGRLCCEGCTGEVFGWDGDGDGDGDGEVAWCGVECCGVLWSVVECCEVWICARRGKRDGEVLRSEVVMGYLVPGL